MCILLNAQASTGRNNKAGTAAIIPLANVLHCLGPTLDHPFVN